MLDNYSYYYNLAIKTKSSIETLEKELEDANNNINNLSKGLADNIKKEKDYEEATDLMKKLVELISTSQIKHIENLINSALTTIFFDRNYTVELNVTELRNTNNLQILLCEELEDGSIVKSKMQDNGFGVKSIIGFILQIYFILYYKLSPIFFMDEAFSTLSDQYVPYLKILMDELKEKYNFIFVLITHDPRFQEIADRTYRIEKGELKNV